MKKAIDWCKQLFLSNYNPIYIEIWAFVFQLLANMISGYVLVLLKASRQFLYPFKCITWHFVISFHFKYYKISVHCSLRKSKTEWVHLVPFLCKETHGPTKRVSTCYPFCATKEKFAAAQRGLNVSHALFNQNFCLPADRNTCLLLAWLLPVHSMP